MKRSLLFDTHRCGFRCIDYAGRGAAIRAAKPCKTKSARATQPRAKTRSSSVRFATTPIPTKRKSDLPEGFVQQDKLVNGKKVTEANVREIIDNGGNGMPAYADMLSKEDKENLIAYLKTL